MTRSNVDCERQVTLRSGRTVLACIADMVGELRAAGHTIAADAYGGAVVIDPPVHYECWFILDSNWRDVVTMLEEQSVCWEHCRR